MFSKRKFGIPHGAAFSLILASSLVFAQDFSQPDTEPSPQAPLIQKANEALAAGDYQTAVKILTNLKSQTPGNPQILYDLGLTLEALQSGSAGTDASQTVAGSGDTPEACYRAAIAADPKFAAPHVALGLLLARKGHPADARTELADAVALPEIQPELKARALRALARLDVNSNPPEASSELLEALKLSPEQPLDMLLSAQIAEASKDLPSAEQAYRRYLATKDGSSDEQATSGLAHVLLVEHHPAEAEQVLQQALKQHPGDPALTAQLAEAYLDSGDGGQTQATPLLEKLHEAHPDDANITRLLARVYSETGHPAQADPLYVGLISGAAGKPDPTLLSDRADALIRLRRPAEAEKLLKQAVADRDGFPSPEAFADATLHLAFAASEIDDPGTTLQALALRATVLPPSPSCLFLEATANDALHQRSKAIEFYEKFLAGAAGSYPEQEAQARRRLSELEHAK